VSQDSTESGKKGVVLLHGLTGHSILLRPIHSQLRKLGYDLLNWSYWSLPSTIESHRERLEKDVAGWIRSAELSRVHLIGHSMGGIIVRSLLGSTGLSQDIASRVGNVVQLVPPNQGSPVAARFWRCGFRFRAFHELSDIAGSAVTTLPDPSGDFRIGILAAKRDRVVPLANTRLKQTADHQIVKAGHTTILFRRRTARLVGNFIQGGKFDDAS
jgi:hypothetical protein